MADRAFSDLESLRAALDGIVRFDGDGIEVIDEAAVRDSLIDQLVWSAAFGGEDVRDASRWLIRVLAPALGAYPASIHDLYMAAGREEYANVTTPAINVRTLTYDLARTILRAGHATASKQILFELARSETSYTDQRPGEYASSILAAAIKENWRGPVFIQGDHYQANAKKYAAGPDAEIGAVADLAREAIAAGYGNIDIDSSTLVDLSFPTLKEQQKQNYVNTAHLTKIIREAEPEGMTISIGGEIGEVGKANSTVEDLEAFMTGYLEELERLESESGHKLTGISKISVQTGTSHGGIVLPDGSIKEVSVDFETLGKLSKEAKKKYGMGGAVQHGASTLPETAFSHFAQADAVEVHLATAFQNAILDHERFPQELTKEIHSYLDGHYADSRKPDQNDTQFYYTTRKNALGAFKRQMWMLPDEVKGEILNDLQPRFELIFRELNVAGQGALVDKYITRVDVPVPAPERLLAASPKGA
ncbi:MAG TPA: class II fructose-bisphosphate aldolase [Thermomicrobiales bacterium]|nr:class II fructose-bisphosphate aldolase [Thermomicrobiales bacterium]